jgi:phosphatidylglycerophosphate synthase
MNPNSEQKTNNAPRIDHSQFFCCGRARRLASAEVLGADPAARTAAASHRVQKIPLQPGGTIDPNRRPMNTRSTRWAQDLACGLSRLGISANQVSLASIAVAVTGAAFLLWSADSNRGAWFLLFSVACIQLRLLANMLDGLIAVEGGRKTPTGELYNEIPDRIADVVLLASAGYASQHGPSGAALGWCAAVLAVSTAYLRALGARRGRPQDFCGPLAKPQRMFLLTMGCLFAAGESFAGLPANALFVVLILINVGTLWTCIRRMHHLATQLSDTAISS